MIAVSAERLLRVWEMQRDAHPVMRAVSLLAEAWPCEDHDAWLHASIGERDAALLALHEHWFGSALHTAMACPHCGERLESSFSVRDVRHAEPALPAPPRLLGLQQQGYAIDYRLPTSDDLLATASHRDAAAQLLRRCVSRAQHGAALIDAAALPEAVVAQLGAEMAQHDPDADLRLALECPACGTPWQARFDIVSYLWGELEDWAQRTLAHVHALARAYGWSERAILALSPARRQMYLDMVVA